MSFTSKGQIRVRAVESIYNAAGYRTAIISHSGQRRGLRAHSLALDGDLVAIAPDGSNAPHFIVEVGGVKKSVSASILEMLMQGLPAGFVPVVVRQTASYPERRWRWSLSSDEGYDSLADLLDAVRSR